MQKVNYPQEKRNYSESKKYKIGQKIEVYFRKYNESFVMEVEYISLKPIMTDILGKYEPIPAHYSYRVDVKTKQFVQNPNFSDK